MTLPPNELDPAEGSAPEPSWVNAAPRRLVERFVLGPEIGRGGMGRVHCAWDPVLKRLLALKILPGGDPEQQLRLLREARNQAKLDHPNICRIHDLGLDGDRPYIAMQLISGPVLSDLRPELDPHAIAGLLAEVAGAVHAAHLAGLIHRDLKPANILVGGSASGHRVPYVVDFGLARDLQALDQTLSWAVMGTPAFMSPEQARGEALGPATDIYSLGATLYAMLSGHPPYEGTTLGGLLESQADGGVRRLRSLAREVPADLETITLKCLEADPAARYSTAKALQEDLQRFLAGRPVLARPVGLLGRLVRWARRKPALAATGAAGLAASLLLAGWNIRTTRLGRLREQAAQRFAMEIRDAEHLLRIERMLPLHDIRPAEGRLRQRMEDIRRGMDRLGGIARGPGLYAMGRGHLALREYDPAIRALRGAWEAGFQAPEVAYALGVAMLEGYHRRKMQVGIGAAPAEALEAAERDLLAPGLRLLEGAVGAKVEHPFLGRALAAYSSGHYAEADGYYSRTLEEAPWLFEAWVGKARNHLQWRGSDPALAGYDRVIAGALEMLRSAQRLAPSDEESRLVQAAAIQGFQMHHSARDRQAEAPLADAQEALDAAVTIRPGSLRALWESSNIALQRGFYELGHGGDPAESLRGRCRPLEELRGREEWRNDPGQWECVTMLHHLAWVIAEADWRFGRDPVPALSQAALVRKAWPNPDAHFVYPMLIEARHLQERGKDPGAVFADATRLMEPILRAQPEQPHYRSIHGELMREKARWLVRSGQRPEPAIRQGLESLERGLRADPKLAYLYYPLPSLHLLRAQQTLAEGGDPHPHLRSAVEAARRGLELNPDNALLRLGAAEACLAAGALGDARRHLDAGERINPRDFRLVLARAELEWNELKEAFRRGGDPSAAQRALERSCRRGLAIKADEPRFRALLEQAAALHTRAGASAGVIQPATAS